MTPPDPNNDATVEQQSAVDQFLRRSLGAQPVPGFDPADFDRRLQRRIQQRSRPSRGAAVTWLRTLFAAYGAISVVTSAAVMHGLGLDWTWTSLAILATLATGFVVAVAGAGKFGRRSGSAHSQ